jgi:nucleoside-diphosphate-sugar epimerase
MKILVTGANGFIGQALCERMLSEGWQVRGTVRSLNHPDDLSSEVDIFQVGSIGPETNWTKALEGVDTVVHLAARVHIMTNDTHDPLTLFREINVAGTERLAREAAFANVKRFIYMSSVKVNGTSIE